MNDKNLVDAQHLSTGRLFIQSWDLLLSQYKTFLIALIVHSARAILASAVVLFCTVGLAWSPIAVIGTFALSAILSYFEIVSICLSVARHQPVHLFRLPKLSAIANWLLSSVLFWLAIGTGFVLLVIPGLTVWNYLCLYGFAISDEDNAFQALKVSFSTVRQAFWQVFLISAIFIVPIILFSGPIFMGLEMLLDLTWTLALATIYTTRRASVKGLDNA